MTHLIKSLIYSSFVFVVLTLLISIGHSQSSLNYQWYLNANGGISQMYGDVQNENNPISKLSDETDYGFGLRLGKYIGPYFTGHLQFLKANLKGAKDKNDLVFNSDLMEVQLGTSINLLNLIFGKKERTFNVYATTGIGAAFFRSEVRRSNGNLVNDYGYTTNGSREESTRETALVWPVGAGLDIKLAKKWYVNLESVLRFTNSDKLDAVVSGSKKDAYYYTSLGLSFNFGSKKSDELSPTNTVVPEVIEDPYANINVDLIYDIPRNLESYQTFEMKCVIHKGIIDGRGELVQILPIGFEVKDTLIDNARMEFKNYTLNLYWDELPKDSVFEITYTVELDRIYGSLPLTSILYLEKTGKEYKFKTNVMINRVQPKEEEEPIVEKEPEAEAETTLAGVEFRVQVRAAYKAQIPLQRLANKYALRDEIKENYVGNWYKYTIGSFSTFEEAKKYRTEIIGEHGVRDAFIVAFYNGERLNDLSELKVLSPDAYPFKTSYKENGTCYRVQILALKNGSVSPGILKDIYQIEEEVNEEVYPNWRKYTVGKCTSKEEAKKLREKLVDKGVIDAFVVIYQNGERITYNGLIK